MTARTPHAATRIGTRSFRRIVHILGFLFQPSCPTFADLDEESQFARHSISIRSIMSFTNTFVCLSFFDMDLKIRHDLGTYRMRYQNRNPLKKCRLQTHLGTTSTAFPQAPELPTLPITHSQHIIGARHECSGPVNFKQGA